VRAFPLRPFVAVVLLASLAVIVPASPAAAPPSYPYAQWVLDENAKPGTRAWRIKSSAPRDIEGFADRVSAKVGDRVRLYVETSAASYRVTAFRLGWYGGDGARRVWRSDVLPGLNQPAPILEPETNTIVAPWSATVAFDVTSRFVEGSYLLKLTSSTGGASYVPLIVRNDASTADLVVQHQTTTWQAYNRWGGYSLYLGPDGTFQTRSRVVSFDRPYDARGAGGMLRALPFIALLEGDGMDVTYWTDNDLHARPWLLRNHRSLVSLNHDEYWSTRMRDGLEAALAAGVNYANLGANAIYRKIRFEPSALGADRRVVGYKVRHEDPLNGVDNDQVTVNWRNPPSDDPESAVLGPMYQCYGVHDDLVVGAAGSWVFAGTGLANGDVIPGAIAGEYDRIWPDEPTPRTVQILAHSPLWCRGRTRYADTTYYTARSGAGVFNVSSTDWVDVIECAPPVDAKSCSPAAVTITRNVLRHFAFGPAGATRPSFSNVGAFGYTLTQPLDP
jgi:hypothetical protein